MTTEGIVKKKKRKRDKRVPRVHEIETNNDPIKDAIRTLKHWDAIRNDNDSNIRDTAGCAGQLAKALRDVLNFFEQR